MSAVPVVSRVVIPLPHAMLPGTEGELYVEDVRLRSDEEKEQILALLLDAWAAQVGDPNAQPDDDPNALASGVFHNGALIGWGALHNVECDTSGSPTIVSGDIVGEGLPGNPPLLLSAAAVAINGHTWEAEGGTCTIEVNGL